jgi:Glucose/sorbosone dehydrogenases
MKRIAIISLLWIISLLFAVIWSYENPENIEYFKNYIKKNKEIKAEKVDSAEEKIIANSFLVKLSQIISLSEKTAFVVYPDKKLKFDPKNLIIYSQNGFIMKNLKSEKLNLPREFTLQRNGGVKTVFFSESESYAFLSAKKGNCYYAAIVNLNNGKEVFKSKCLLDIPKNIDFNGLGSSNIHHDNKIYLAVGTPEKHASKNSFLAQDLNSIFGKILEIDKENIQNNLIKPMVFTSGHRVPQGLTKIDGNLFNAEHGPKGGDEINILEKGENMVGQLYLMEQII